MSSVSSHLLGTELVVSTTSGQSFRGVLFCYDIAESNSFVLQERVSKGKVNYHWIKCSVVRNLSVSAVSPMNIDALSLPALDLHTLEEQAKKADESFRKNISSIGVGVTREAQVIFDALSKTMPCVWSQDKIVCYSVTISPPYTNETCEGTELNELERVRKVLDGARKITCNS